MHTSVGFSKQTQIKSSICKQIFATFQLIVVPSEEAILPGGVIDIKARGPANMWVGFNIIDKALLLQNNENILKEDTVRWTPTNKEWLHIYHNRKRTCYVLYNNNITN